jgi:hypothetical protein
MSETVVERPDMAIPPMPASDVGIRIKFHKGGGYTLWGKRKGGPRRVMVLVPEDEAQAGREALELLRNIPGFIFTGGASSQWLAARAALLARCEGES